MASNSTFFEFFAMQLLTFNSRENASFLCTTLYNVKLNVSSTYIFAIWHSSEELNLCVKNFNVEVGC